MVLRARRRLREAEVDLVGGRLLAAAGGRACTRAAGEEEEEEGGDGVELAVTGDALRCRMCSR